MRGSITKLLGRFSASGASEIAPGARRSLGVFLDSYGIVLALILIVVVLTILQPTYFPSRENLTNVARQTSMNALLALGQFVVILTAGIDLSVGSVLALSMVSLALMIHSDVPSLIAVALALGIGMGCGLLNGWGITKLRLPHPFISTLAMLNIARGATLLISNGVPISGLPDEVRVFGAGDIPLFGQGDQAVVVPVSLIVVLVLYFAMWVFLVRTRTGRHIYAIGGNPQAALYAGINVDRVLNLVYILSGGLAAVAGIVLAGRTNSGYPNAGIGSELDAIAAVIIGGASFFGGRGTVLGTLVGALIMGLLRNGLNLMNVSAFWQQIVIGIVIIVAVYVDVLRRRTARR
ncbi:MAG: sugar ABC transporter permease [Chloroflexi bacterium RBG_16_57_9]|nr:MAG: sugar ABC transporter permease [Chloroflexi bacterium RBG_16_57_9]